MAVERAQAGTSLVDVLDRVLDKGVVIDAYVRVTLVGIDLIGVEARIVVASVETYLKYADTIGGVGTISRPMLAGDGTTSEARRLRAENQELRSRLNEEERADFEASAEPRTGGEQGVGSEERPGSEASAEEP